MNAPGVVRRPGRRCNRLAPALAAGVVLSLTPTLPASTAFAAYNLAPVVNDGLGEVDGHKSRGFGLGDRPIHDERDLGFKNRGATIRSTTTLDGWKVVEPVGVDYRVTSKFGVRRRSLSGKPRYHAGVDMAAPRGSLVLSMANGVVVKAERQRGYGKLVTIRHADGLETRYAHLDRFLVKAGDTVEAGKPVGRIGMTGRTTGPHLHFELRRDGKAINPMPVLAGAERLTPDVMAPVAVNIEVEGEAQDAAQDAAVEKKAVQAAVAKLAKIEAIAERKADEEAEQSPAERAGLVFATAEKPAKLKVIQRAPAESEATKDLKAFLQADIARAGVEPTTPAPAVEEAQEDAQKASEAVAEPAAEKAVEEVAKAAPKQAERVAKIEAIKIETPKSEAPEDEEGDGDLFSDVADTIVAALSTDVDASESSLNFKTRWRD